MRAYKKMSVDEYSNYCDRIGERYAQDIGFARHVDWMTRHIRANTFISQDMIDAAELARILSGENLSTTNGAKA